MTAEAETEFDVTRQLPQDLDAERAALGSMLLSEKYAGELLDLLDSSDFYNPHHETIFNAIADLYTSGKPVDPVTVASYLTEHGDLVRIGGAPYLHTLFSGVPVAAHGPSYAETVKKLAVRRKMVEGGQRLIQMGYETHGDDITAIASRVVTEVAEIETAAFAVAGVGVLDAVCPDLGPFLDGTHTAPEPTIGSRDDGVRLFYTGEVNRVFGKSESGKTWLTLYAGLQHLRAGGDLVFCDYENGPAAVVPRLLALGATRETLSCKRFRYLDLRDAVLTADMRTALAKTHTNAAIVIDSVAGLVASHAKNSNYVDDVEALLTRDLAVLTRAGHGVILIDHESDRSEGAGRSSGSHRKRDLISGTSLHVEPATPFRKWTAEGGPDGRSRVFVDKDRHAGVRAATVRVKERDYLGDFTGRPSPDGRLSCRLWWPDLPPEETETGDDTKKYDAKHWARILIAADLPEDYGRERLKPFAAEHGIKLPGRNSFLNEILAAVKTLRQARPE